MGLCSVHHMLFLLLPPPQGRTSHTFLLLQCGVPPMETVFYHLLQCESLPRAAVLHPLLHCGSFHGVQSFRQRLLQCGSLQGHQSCSKPAPAWPPSSMGSQPLLGTHVLQCGVLHGLQGKLCASAWNTSFPFFLTDLDICRAVSHTWSHNSLLHPQLLLRRFFSPLLKYVMASSRSILELDGIGSTGHGGSFSEKSPLWPPCSQNLVTQTQGLPEVP